MLRLLELGNFFEVGDSDIRFQCGTPLKIAAYDIRSRGTKGVGLQLGMGTKNCFGK